MLCLSKREPLQNVLLTRRSALNMKKNALLITVQSFALKLYRLLFDRQEKFVRQEKTVLQRSSTRVYLSK